MYPESDLNGNATFLNDEEGPMKPENLTCPDCRGPMTSRQNKATGQRFWGCVRFPQCRGSRDTDGLSAAERVSSRDRDSDRVPGPGYVDDGLPSDRQRSRDSRSRWRDDA